MFRPVHRLLRRYGPLCQAANCRKRSSDFRIAYSSMGLINTRLL